MEPRIIPYIVCSTLSLACICVQLFFLMRPMIRTALADRRESVGTELPCPPLGMLQTKQTLSVITAMSGLAYCSCNLALRSEGSLDAEYVARIILTFVVLLSECTTVAELAFLSWSTYRARIHWALYCVLVTGIASVTLRILAHRSQLLGSLALWFPPAVSSVVKANLLVLQIVLVEKTSLTHSKKAYVIIALASRQFSVFPFWAWVGLSDQPIAVVVLQHVQILIDTHDPSHWPGPIWERQTHPKAGMLALTDQPTRRDLPCEQSGKSDSKRDLLSARSNEASFEATFDS